MELKNIDENKPWIGGKGQSMPISLNDILEKAKIDSKPQFIQF